MPRQRQATRRFLASVLFTDIVGSTERAAELGDRAWRDLLEQHNAIVRRELRAFHGREMGTAGDGFLAVFEAPEQAVACAESIIRAVGSLGLQVRAGVHTGECEMVGGEVAGMAVHIGARVAALAGPGEVLVSGSVRDLMTGSDCHFEGGEVRQLKGVADPWRVYRLLPQQRTAEPERRYLPSMLPLYTRGRRRRRLLLASGLVLALALSTLGYWLVRTGVDAEVVVGENEVGVIGPGAEARVGEAVPVGQRPTAVTAGFGSVWVTNSTDDSVTRIDRRTRAALPIPVGSTPSGVATGAGSVWVANSGEATVTRIDPSTGRQTTIPVRPGPTGIVVAFGSVWVTNALDASVTEIDPATHETEVVPVGGGPTGIAAGAGYLWVTNQADGTVTRFNPRTHEADAPVTVGTGPVGIAVANGAVWVANNLEGSLSRIDVEDLTVTARLLDKDGGAYGVAIRGDDVWVSNEYAGTLMRVTARTFRLADTVPLSGAPLGLAYVGKELWFTSAGGGSALHRGGVLTVVAPGVVFPDGHDPAVFDPTTEYDLTSWRLAQVTNDGLVGFRRAGGAQTAGIVADLATTLPKPTDGGLTYTFHLRKGVRYSTGAPVLAGDIRRGIERTAVYNVGAGYYYAPAIKGGQACVDAADAAVAAGHALPDCDLSEGIVADDRAGTVTFHLARPTPDFVHQLALASAYAVPQDTPVTLKPGTFLPATGPYMIDSYTPKQAAADGHGRLELVRNRYFREWSEAAQPDGYADRIVIETGYGEQEAMARVADGRADLLWFDATGDADRLRATYGQLLHTGGGPFMGFVELNTAKPPFDNIHARRALAYAVDRAVLADAMPLPAQPTCQLVPPDFPGYQPYCPFTVGDRGSGKWAGPDMATARDLVARSGTAGAAVVVRSTDDPAWRRAARHVADVLDRLGYRASVRVGPSDWRAAVEEIEESGQFQANISAWGADYPAASQFVAVLASCDPAQGFMNFTRHCDPEVQEQMAAALRQQASDPGGENSDAWAAVDHAVVDAAAHIPFGATRQQVLVSRRVGNTLLQPGFGPLIAQMWVQ